MFFKVLPGQVKLEQLKVLQRKLVQKYSLLNFHAETNYSDFIFGIRPDTTNQELRYKEYLGSFSKALKYAIEHNTEKVILIIDEINRANLSKCIRTNILPIRT